MSNRITVTLPDGKPLPMSEGCTVFDVAQEIGPGLAKAALAGRIAGKLVDLRTPLTEDVELAIITTRDPEAGEVIRHSAEHIMADAVKRLFPDAQVDAGRADHSEKFQYDFLVENPFTPEDIERIDAEMKKIIKEGAAFERRAISREEAHSLFEGLGENLKLERLGDIPEGDEITVFQHGDFVDLCRGPHVAHAGQVGASKLLEVSGTYFRGDESAQPLQRIYGTAFWTKEELEQHLEWLEKAKESDHRKIGTEMDLFSVHADVGGGLVFWHPNLGVVRHCLEQFWWELHTKGGYKPVYTPHISREALFNVSGHLENYGEMMYSPMAIDEQPFRVKPMNCPGHIMIYKNRGRSYRELPLRWAELGNVYRYERSGTLHGAGYAWLARWIGHEVVYDEGGELDDEDGSDGTGGGDGTYVVDRVGGPFEATSTLFLRVGMAAYGKGMYSIMPPASYITGEARRTAPAYVLPKTAVVQAARVAPPTKAAGATAAAATAVWAERPETPRGRRRRLASCRRPTRTATGRRPTFAPRTCRSG